MIPSLNVPDLMLRKDIVQSASDGKFHIYPVGTIDRGMTILTGIEAGEKDKEGNYPPGMVNFLVDEKLKSIAKGLKDFGVEEKKED